MSYESRLLGRQKLTCASLSFHFYTHQTQHAHGSDVEAWVISQSEFAMLFDLRNKKKINNKVDVNDEDIEIVVIKYCKVLY